MPKRYVQSKDILLFLYWPSIGEMDPKKRYDFDCFINGIPLKECAGGDASIVLATHRSLGDFSGFPLEGQTYNDLTLSSFRSQQQYVLNQIISINTYL